MKKFLQEFKEFALKGNVMDMAVGVIIGAAFGNIVTALTEDFINPLIACIGGAEVAGKIKLGDTGQYLNWGSLRNSYHQLPHHGILHLPHGKGCKQAHEPWQEEGRREARRASEGRSSSHRDQRPAQGKEVIILYYIKTSAAAEAFCLSWHKKAVT